MELNDDILKALIQTTQELNLKLKAIYENVDLKNLDDVQKQHLAIYLTHANVTNTNNQAISNEVFGQVMDNDDLFKFLKIKPMNEKD